MGNKMGGVTLIISKTHRHTKKRENEQKVTKISSDFQTGGQAKPFT
jgi:hypothetical protein